MFNFIKKGVEKEEKDKRKREKDGKKKRERGSMTAEELLRLDEMRRSLKIRGRKKEKEKLPSGITADYSENFFGDLERDPEFRKSGSLPGHTASKSSPSFNRGELSTQSDSSEASLNSLTSTQAPQKVLPPLPPRPPKRGILKGSKTNVMNPEYYENHDPNLLVRNTLQNEVIISQNNYSVNVNNFQRHINANVQQTSNLLPECSAYHSQSDAGMSSSKNNLLSITSTSLSAESLTDTTNSSFATPPFSLSPVGESHGFSKMQLRIDEKNIDGPLPEITQFKLPSPRELTIFRTSRGDFGFQLRRAIVTDKLSKTNKKTVIFAEPGVILSHKNETGLLPGDVLLEVNGIEVHDKSREDIIDMIKNSNSNVLVKVQPIPELCELIRRCGVDGQEIVLDDSNIRAGTLRRSGSLRFKKTGAKSDEELASERASLDNEKLWLVHKSGFTAVRILSDSSSLPTEIGKVKVKFEDSDTVLEVDEDDLEKANPPQLDRVEDLCQLRYINESSILYLLRQRYGNNLIHTYSAGNLIIINPQCTLSIYNDKVAALFRGCKSEDMPPHIYSLAQTTYRSLLSTRKDQSIILIGRSGSGKTHNFRHILSYLLHCAGCVNKILNVERLNALNTVVEAFGNARTCLNLNATRCTNLINLDFDQSGQIASLSLQILMLEKQRIGKRPDGEATFNVFYWLLMGAEGSLAKQLLLDSSPPNNNLFVTSLYKNEDRQRAVMEFTKLNLALKALEISDKECFVIWCIIAVIYHLGHAGVVQVGTKKWQFADPIHASKAARLFGTTSEELSQTIWDYPVSPTKAQCSSDKDKPVTGLEALEGFVVGLYSELVTLINSLINRCLTYNIHSAMSIIIVDSPGFQNPASCGEQREANFSDFCHNYVQERLHLLFHNVNLIAPRDRYTQERIDLNMDEIYTELKFPIQLISILDKSPPSGVLKTSQTDLREVDRRGLLWLLEEESIYPNSSDETFIDRLFQHYGCKDHQMYIRRGNCAGHLVIQHFQGTNPVTYNARGWLKASKENPINRVAINFLQESTKEEIRELFAVARGLHIGVSDGSQSLRRVSSIKRTCPSAVKRKSVSLQIKFMTDGLIETLRRTRPRFVFCMLAHHNAGLTDLLPGAANENIINVPLLRSQIRGAEILPATRMYKQGFPEYVPHGEFKRRFRLLAPSTSEHPESTVPSVTIVLNGQVPATDAIDEAREVEEMLMLMDVDITMYRIGLTQCSIMTDSFTREAVDIISEFLTFVWVVIAFFVTVIVFLGQKIEYFAMPTFRTINFGQKNREERPEVEDVNGTGLLNRKIVVERVKNVFGKTLKPKERSEDEEFDFRKVLKLFHAPKKSVTFADQDEVITMGNEILAEFETNASFREEELAREEDDEVKNLLFHEVDENFTLDNKSPVEFWKKDKNESAVISKGAPSIRSGPPPLPPRLYQKFGPKTRPSIPPPLPPKAGKDTNPPVVRRDLKKIKPSSSDVIGEFNETQANVSAEKPYEYGSPYADDRVTPEKGGSDKYETRNVFVFDEFKPLIFLDKFTKSPEFASSTTPSFTTFKPEITVKTDWKEDFFQPLNKSLISSPKIVTSRPDEGKAPIQKSSKIPKIVEEIMEKASAKKLDCFNAETLKQCRVNVSTLVNNFEQIQKESGNNRRVCVESASKSNTVNRSGNNECVTNSVPNKLAQAVVEEMKNCMAANSEKEDKQENGLRFKPGAIELKTRPFCVPLPFSTRPTYQPLRRNFSDKSNVDKISNAEEKVFFRVGVLAQLESQRDEKLADLIIQFQSRCRGYLARKKLAKLKVQDLAVRCIQKNVRKLMQVREWPWWRLYVKVTPLLNVHRTEEELTARLQELETLKSKMEKLESERNQLKVENDKLETKTEAKSVIAMGSRESVNFRTNVNYEGIEKGIDTSEELPKRRIIVEKNENYENKINGSLKNESTRKNVISSQQIIASENSLKKSVSLNNYINPEKRVENETASGSEKNYEKLDVGSPGKDIGNQIKSSENAESIFLKGKQIVNGNLIKTDIANGIAHDTTDPQNTKPVNGLPEKKDIKTNNLRQNGKQSSFTENPGAVLPAGKSGKKSRRESTIEKSSTKSIEIPAVNVSRPRSVSIVTLPSVTNIHEKIHTLTSGGTKTQEFKTQPKIHKLEDKLLTIGKEEPKKHEIRAPLTRGPNKIDPALQSKILKFGTPSVGSKLPRRQSTAKSSASKTDRVVVCNGYSVKNIEIGTSTSNEENLVAEESGDDSPISTLSSSLKITLNQTHVESNGKRDTENLVNDVILMRNQIEKLTRSTESFIEEKKELPLCGNQEQGHSVSIKKENVERVGCENKEKIKTIASLNDKGSMSWSNSEVSTSAQCAKVTGPTSFLPKLQEPALPLPEIVDIKELKEDGRVQEIKNNNSPQEISYSSEGVLVTLAATNDPVKVGKPKLFIKDSESKFESKSCEFPCEKMEAEDVCVDFSRERSPFSPFSLLSDSSFEHYIPSVDFGSGRPQSPLRSSSVPRRIFPQTARRFTCELDDFDKEDSPVIIDAGISFDLVRKTSIRQQFKPKPAFAAPKTASNSLSGKISEFLNKTDHVMEEWNRIGKSKSNIWQSFAEAKDYPKMRSKSATNIMIKGVLNFAKHQSDSLRSRPVSQNSFSNISDIDELNEINADLSEERATGTLQAERLEAETAERVRLEQELSQVQEENKNLLQTSEKLEMELFYARADVNGLSEGEAEGEDGGGDATIYKQKCERAMRELEFTRRRLQQQHEDDLEQLVALKKQLEKKLADAYEEVDEQRQVAAQWKRKVQKFQSEMNDVRLLLEEQSSRNNLLEKKQRKFDSEIQLLQDELRSEKNQKERLSREKDMAFAEKYSMEQNLSSVRLELELKEEKLSALSREVEELTRGGGSEQEVTQLRKAKHDLELKLKEQEEELDELAGQVSMLEGTKLRLEMSLESLRKELRREMSQREDELDEVRSNSQKKLKALEAQLENEHEERTLLLREKHELERRLNDVEERGRHHRAADEDALLRLRRDLKKTKALLRDAQMMLERAKQDSPSKAALRALKNQLEDAELARASAVKAKQSLESELNEVNGQLEELIRAKGDSENRCQAAQRECNALRTQVDENEEELAELLKKYRQTVQQLSAEQLANQETAGALAEAEAERASLRDQLAELTAKLEASTLLNPVSGMAQKRLEIRVKELESRLELEQTTRSRLEVQITRLKENVERLTEECILARNKEQTANDLTRKLQRSLREAKEEMAQQQAKEQESAHKRKELEKRLETAEQEAMTARTDLRLAVKRIEDLQNAMSGEIASDSDRTDSEEDDSGDESLMLHFPSSLSSSRGSKTPDLSPR